jgi:hypothetical protein
MSNGLDTPEQARRIRRMFSAVVLIAIDDAIDEERAGHRGPAWGAAGIGRWARSRDGREVLELAGIEPTEHAAARLEAVVRAGKRMRREAA